MLEPFAIKIDKEGRWYYHGNLMFRKDILRVFFDHLGLDDEGRYFIEMGPERCYLDVEDTVYVVVAVYKTTDHEKGEDVMHILLNDESIECLDLNSLFIGDHDVLYCRVKAGKFIARFLRKSYYQIAEFIEPHEDGLHFFVRLNGRRYMIRPSSSPTRGEWTSVRTT